MSNFIPDLPLIRNGANFLGDIVRRAFEAVQAKFPVVKDDIASFFMSRADWNGAGTVPPDNLPMQDIINAVTSAGSSSLNCIDILRNMVVQYRDDDELYFGPGHVLHRGVFKKQTCNDDGTWVSAVAASLTIPAECPTSPGTTSGLVADSWYYVYAKLDVAGDNPEYRISLTPPVICDGAGPEHPVYNKLRFLGSFRTTAAPDAFIRPFFRYSKGRVFWREVVVGPQDPTTNYNQNTAGFVNIDISAEAPPSADVAFLTLWADSENEMLVRAKGDSTEPDGYHIEDTSDGGNVPRVQTTWLEVPVITMDTATDTPRTTATFDLNSDSGASKLGVIGYSESLG